MLLARSHSWSEYTTRTPHVYFVLVFCKDECYRYVMINTSLSKFKLKDGIILCLKLFLDVSTI